MQTELLTRYFSQPRQVFWVNEGFQIDVSGEEQNKNLLISGTSGGGKSVLLSGIADQVGQGMLIDTKGKGQSTIEQMGFQGWHFFDTKAKRLQINVSELSISSAYVLFSEDDAREQRAMAVFRHFCALPLHKKKFSALRKMLEAIKEYNLANDLEMVFARRDNGIPLSELFNKKICWNVRGVSPFNKAIGLLIKQIYDAAYHTALKKPYFVFCDDAQSYATSRTTLGKAFALSFAEGRAFNFVVGLSGTHTSFLNYGCKVNADVLFYFRSRKEEKKLLKQGVDFKDARMVSLRKAHPNGGTFFVETGLPVFVDGKRLYLDEPFPTYYNVYGYLTECQKKQAKGNISIKQDFFG